MRRFAARVIRHLGYVRGPRAMSHIRRAWVLFRHQHANIQIHPSAYLGPGFSLFVPFNGTFIAGPHVEFRRGFRAEVEGDGRIEIGAHSMFTNNMLMQCSTVIEIGERCIFGQSTLVVDGNHRFRDIARPLLSQGYDLRPVSIEDDAMISTKCSILASVGRRAFIGANSVVTKPVPAYTVAVGAPARVIEYFGPAEERPEGLEVS